MKSFTDISLWDFTSTNHPIPPTNFTSMYRFKSPPSPCSKHLRETLGYLRIGEMKNFEKPFLQLKSNIVKIPPVAVKVKICREENFFTRWWKFEVRGQAKDYNNISFFFNKYVENEAEFYQTCFCFLKELYINYFNSPHFGI